LFRKEGFRSTSDGINEFKLHGAGLNTNSINVVLLKYKEKEDQDFPVLTTVGKIRFVNPRWSNFPVLTSEQLPYPTILSCTIGPEIPVSGGARMSAPRGLIVIIISIYSKTPHSLWAPW